MKQFKIEPYYNYSFEPIQRTDLFKLSLFRKNLEIMNALDKEIESDQEVIELLNLMYPTNNVKNVFWWFIYLENVLIGNFGLKLDIKNARAEIGYALFKEFWGKKHMTACLPVLLEFAFNELNCHSLEARINPLNKGSQRLLLNNNFVLEGYLKEDYRFKSEFLDTEIYSLLNRNYVPRETFN